LDKLGEFLHLLLVEFDVLESGDDFLNKIVQYSVHLQYAKPIPTRAPPTTKQKYINI
jgi:hypothetical protein